MAAYTWSKRTYVEHRFTLTLPTNATELDKAVEGAVTAWASENSTAESFVPDDALTITTEDDTLVISFRIEEES